MWHVFIDDSLIANSEVPHCLCLLVLLGLLRHFFWAKAGSIIVWYLPIKYFVVLLAHGPPWIVMILLIEYSWVLLQRQAAVFEDVASWSVGTQHLRLRVQTHWSLRHDEVIWVEQVRIIDKRALLQIIVGDLAPKRDHKLLQNCRVLLKL